MAAANMKTVEAATAVAAKICAILKPEHDQKDVDSIGVLLQLFAGAILTQADSLANHNLTTAAMRLTRQ